MRKRKKQPYIKIIDLKAEQKEYVNLCNNNSEKYHTYTAWEAHIKNLLKKFNSPTDLYNFKRYCVNQDRVFSNTSNLFGSYVVLLFTLILDKFAPYLTIAGFVILLMYSFWYGISQHKTVIKGSCFFKDIIEIIEKIEKEQAQS